VGNASNPKMQKLNLFMVAIGIQYLFAMAVEINRKHVAMSIVYLCYGISAVALAFIE
jgi:hypothetical protein